MSGSKQLEARREALLAQCSRQRAELAAEMQTLRHAATPSGIGASLLSTLWHNKLLAIGGALALAFIKPRRLIPGLEAGLIGWEMWKNAAPIVQKVREHFHKT
jgi:hypothetical protein